MKKQIKKIGFSVMETVAILAFTVFCIQSTAMAVVKRVDSRALIERSHYRVASIRIKDKIEPKVSEPNKNKQL